MEIIDEITDRLTEHQKINDRLIYFVDIYLEIERKTIYKTRGVKREKRYVILKNETWELKPKTQNALFFERQLAFKLELTEKETFKITKIILKKELGCSIYE